MLWKKESNKPNAQYVDIFAMEKHTFVHNMYAELMSMAEEIPLKNDRIAKEKREHGNLIFSKMKWIQAMILYNDSLRFAKSDSKNISLAFANRAACFLNMKKYEQCLIDIDLAIKAGYPTDLMPKLERRKADCLKKMEEDSNRNIIDLKLSYDRNEKIPFMANAVKFERDANGECSAFANEDIDIGQTIVIEKSYINTVHTEFSSLCNICLKEYANLIPCSKCTSAMFCSKECQQQIFHDYECGLTINGSDELDGPLKGTVRAIFMGINLFPTANELIEFVEQTKQLDKHAEPNVLFDEKSKYRAYIQLPLTRKQANESHVFPTFVMYKFLLDHPKIKPIFNTERHRRFLMHFALMLGLLPVHEIMAPSDFPFFPSVSLDDVGTLCSYSILSKRYFQHSCAPNVLWSFHDGHCIFRTIRPIRKGEQLLECRFTCMPHILLSSKADRQATLSEYEKFIGKCKCSRCKGLKATKQERQQLKSDPIYKTKIAMARVKKEYDEEMQQLAKDCEEFLRKFAGINWCDEIGTAVHIYARIIKHKLKHTTINCQ